MFFCFVEDVKRTYSDSSWKTASTGPILNTFLPEKVYKCPTSREWKITQKWLCTDRFANLSSFSNLKIYLSFIYHSNRRNLGFKSTVRVWSNIYFFFWTTTVISLLDNNIGRFFEIIYAILIQTQLECTVNGRVSWETGVDIDVGLLFLSHLSESWTQHVCNR